MVMTLHDYKLACTTYQFLDHGQPCTACLDRRFRHAVQRRCNDGSLGASAVSAFELWAHTRMGAYDAIGAFVGPSQFLVDKMTEAGVYPDRVRHVDNFVAAPAAPRPLREGVIAFAGRLSPEKGYDVLIRALGHAKDRLGDWELTVIGEGKLRGSLVRQAREAGVEKRITFVGRVTNPYPTLASADVLVHAAHGAVR
jgi:glycosyltransferase involved in cell wall biosynthesis